jgi:hypothetical protein
MFSDYELNKAEYLAFTERISCHTVGILMQGRAGVGTGTLLAYDRKRLVLTASHNLDVVDISDLRFYFRPEGSMQERSVRDDRGIRHQVLSTGDRLIFRGEPVRDKKNDIAALVLEPGQKPIGAATFNDVTELKEYPIRDGNSIVILGFPVANSAEIVPGARVLGTTSDHGRYDSTRNSIAGLPSAYDPDDQFLLNYTRIEDDLAPHGFSGAAAWVNRDATDVVWKPNPVLAGVVTGYLSKLKLLVVAQLRPVIGLLKRL